MYITYTKEISNNELWAILEREKDTIGISFCDLKKKRRNVTVKLDESASMIHLC